MRFAPRFSPASRRSTRSSTATRHARRPYILNLSFPGLDAETAIDSWRDLVAISNGAACTSQSYTCSHVLSAMQLPEWRKDGALRFSWCAASPEPDWRALVSAVERRRGVERVGLG